MSAGVILIFAGRIGGPLWGVIVPGVILLVALWVTWALYKHFSE